jgi:hypothetical protein
MSQELSTGTRIEHERYGEGIISRATFTSYEIFFARGGKMDILKSSKELSVIEESENGSGGAGIDIDAFEEILAHLLDKHGMLQEVVPLGDRWMGGKIVITASSGDIKPKEIPVETFFHKIVMVRDRLRVLEQNINAHSKLNDEDKINLQQYISRIYGSLTTFNILFKNKEDNFVGTGEK